MLERQCAGLFLGYFLDSIERCLCAYSELDSRLFLAFDCVVAFWKNMRLRCLYFVRISKLDSRLKVLSLSFGGSCLCALVFAFSISSFLTTSTWL
jgi:hypothetical protein